MASRTWEQYENYILQKWPLTRREVQVAIECIKGKKNKEIASLLGIGSETVNKTLDNIYRATEVNGRDQLVAKLLIADIENTPLQQAVILTGAGSAYVGAGFLATLYESRSERKRPRTFRHGSTTSKTNDRSKPAMMASATADVPSLEQVGAVAAYASVSSGRLTPTESPGQMGENLTCMSSPESQSETATSVDKLNPVCI